MKRFVILGCGIVGFLAANCSAPYPDADGMTGSGATRGGPSTGTGGSSGFFGTGGGKVNPGTYTEALVEDEDSPPPLVGGTLTIIAQGHRAAVSDPDRDQVVTVDLDAMSIVSTASLARGDEPNRSAEDAAGRLHVVLRGGRGVAMIDTSTGKVFGRVPVCRHPRGIAYDAAADTVHVACAGGELVSYEPTEGQILRKVRLERDLRDVVVDGNRLLVSRFRAAELLVVESDGTVSAKLKPAPNTARSPDGGFATAIPAVAWRTVASPDGGALMVYQSLLNSFVPTTPGGYGSGTCGGIISTSVSLLRVDRPGFTYENLPAVLPIDLATTSTRAFAVASGAWTPTRVNGALQPYVIAQAPTVTTQEVRVSAAPCGTGGPPPPPPQQTNVPVGAPTTDGGIVSSGPQGRVVALAFASNQLVLQTREPATLVMGSRSIALPGRSRKHTGHELFHLSTVSGIACASCHPEGAEDGQVWTFASLGPRRTQNVSGGISGTEPFHWNGDMDTFGKLAHDVFQSRMRGPSMGDEYVGSLQRWIDKIPRLESPAAEDPAAAERGMAIFNSADAGCATCHNGERLTNNASVDVRTGGIFQVPSLRGLAWRAPYMHQGCAPTLDARFTNCGGGDAHGRTSQLTAQEKADLIAYLDTL